jgi:hypothetical protein
MSKVTPLFVFLNLSLLYGQPVTYFNDIQGIFSQNCTSCHNQNGAAPFALENLGQVIEHKGIISSVVERNIMPPWRPDPNYSHFLNERILSISDKQKIIDWIQQGCQPGSPGTDEKLQKSDALKNNSADLVLKLPFDVKIPASTTDTIVLVEMSYEIAQDTFVTAFQFLPAKNAGIHHMFASIEPLNKTANKSDYDDLPPLPFWDGKTFNQRLSYKYLDFYGGWRPGEMVTAMPPHIGWLIPKKGLLLYQLHYGPSPVAFTSRFELRLIYSKDTIQRSPGVRKYGTQAEWAPPYPPLVIPADSVMMFTLNGAIDSDYSIMAISPHMHLLGKSIKVWVYKPNGDTIKLINIKDWDFNQQEFYYPPTLLKVEKGDMLQAEAVMNNTTANINNPNKPPILVKDGPNTRNEMIQIYIYVVAYKKGDETLRAKGDK